MINDNEQKKFKWNDVAVIKINDGDAIVIILMFDTYEEGNRFTDMFLSKYTFAFRAKINPENQEFAFEIEFKDSALLMIWLSGLTGFDCPPFTWFNQSLPTFITNGIWIKSKRKQGKEYKYNPDVLPLNNKLESSTLENEIARAFSKAIRIEFYPESQKPSLIILIFDKPQGTTAYNDLFDIASCKTTYLKFSEGENLAISFIDAVEDFHITVLGLRYDKNRLKAFKDSLPKNQPFAFLLGLDSPEKERPIILQTKEKFEVLNLAGYIE